MLINKRLLNAAAMKDSTLLRIAMLCSTAGLVMLWIVSAHIPIDEASIAGIGENHVGETVRIKGTVSDISSRDNLVTISIVKPETTTVVMFGDEEPSLEKGDNVEVTAQVKEYKGGSELVADRIDKI